jgi:hypothetical protein
MSGSSTGVCRSRDDPSSLHNAAAGRKPWPTCPVGSSVAPRREAARRWRGDGMEARWSSRTLSGGRRPSASVEPAFDNRSMDGIETVPTYGMPGWPTWVHHSHREMHRHVLEIIEPDIGAATPASTSRYILLADGPFAYLKGHDGEQYITATRRGGRYGSRRTPPARAGEPRRATDSTLLGRGKTRQFCPSSSLSALAGRMCLLPATGQWG